MKKQTSITGRKTLAALLCTLVFLVAACRSDGTPVEGKWQLHEVRSPQGTAIVDSVFFNFMDGVFTAICVSPKGEYASYYGRYKFDEPNLLIHSIDWDIHYYDWEIPQALSSMRFLMWEGNQREFETITSSSRLLLTHGDSTLVFKKY